MKVKTKLKIKIKKLENFKDIYKLPKYATEHSAGFDLLSMDFVELKPHEFKVVKTGLAVEIPEGYEMQIRSRSGLAAKNGIFVLNSPGTVDCFTDEMFISTIDGDKNIYDIKINDVILSFNEKTQEIEKDVINAIVNKGKMNIYKIETENGYIEISENALVYTKSGLKYAKNLTKNDKILFLN